MGNSNSLLSESDLNYLVFSSQFTRSEIIQLYKRFNQIDKDKKGFILQHQLLNIPELAMNPLAHRLVITLFDYFCCESHHDVVNHHNTHNVLPNSPLPIAPPLSTMKTNSFGHPSSSSSSITTTTSISTTWNSTHNSCKNENDFTLNFKQFVKGLSLLSKGSKREDKLKFAFNVYDVDRDGYISQQDLRYIIQQMVGQSMDQSQIQSLVDQTILDADTLDKDGSISFLEFKRTMYDADLEEVMAVDIFS